MGLSYLAENDAWCGQNRGVFYMGLSRLAEKDTGCGQNRGDIIWG